MTAREFTPSADQRAMAEHLLAGPRRGLWAAMGTGKTSGTLLTLDAMLLSGATSKPTLVLAPLRVAQSTWPDEARKWRQFQHLEIEPIVGDARARAAVLANAQAGRSPIYTMNYDNLQWLMERLDGGSFPFGTVVADESTRLKSFRLGGAKGRRARAIAAVAHKHCDRWVNLTGTPTPQGVVDLWGQTWFLDAGERLGRTFTAFEQRWFRMKRSGHGIEPLAHAAEEIAEKVRDLHLTIAPADTAQPIVRPVEIELPARARQMYQDMERQLFAMVGTVEVEAPSFGVAMGKCLQIASGAVYTDTEGAWAEVHDAKIAALESIIEEASGMPVLVSYEFRHSLARLLKAFPRGRQLDANPETIRAWNRGDLPVLFAHPASAGHGLNLQDGGNILAFFDHSWNLEYYQQIVERVGPMRQKQAGHDRPVYLYPIVARDTFDEDVIYRQRTKAEVQQVVLDAMKRRGNG